MVALCAMLLAVLTAAALPHTALAAAGVCAARSSTPVLLAADRRECVTWPDALLEGVSVDTGLPLAQSGVLHTQYVCSVEVVNGVAAGADADADLAVCTTAECPYKWAFGVNFVGEVLLYRVALATTNTDVRLVFTSPAAVALTVVARWRHTPQVGVAVTAACGVTATVAAAAVVAAAAASDTVVVSGTSGGAGLTLAIPDGDLRNGVLYVAVVATGDFSASTDELLDAPAHVSVDVNIRGE